MYILSRITQDIMKPLTVMLNEQTKKELVAIAKSEGIPASVLARNQIIKLIRRKSSTQRKKQYDGGDAQ